MIADGQESQPQPAELQRVWNANAAFWDDHVGPEGNDFHRVLVAPAQLRLLQLAAGERVVELACGNGQFSREMAALGARVLATDFSPVFVERAQAHARAAGLDVEYRTADVTDEHQLRALATEEPFDAVVCTMAIHDIADLGPMARIVRELLSSDGRFVFSVMHPAFNGTNPVFLAETGDDDGEVVTTYALKISRYHGGQPERGLGILGQPEPHWYFPRTLTGLLAPFLAAGWALDALEEPSFPPDTPLPEKPFSWRNYPLIPPVLVVRLRPRAKP